MEDPDYILDINTYLNTDRQFKQTYTEAVHVLNEAPRHEDVLGEMRYSSTHS
jgi:hypothetical protein